MKKTVLATTLAMLAAACGGPEFVEANPEAIDQQLRTEYGGEVTTDEEPGFGDPALIAELGVEDRAVVDATIDRVEMRDARHVIIAIAWGYLRPNPEFEAWVDWSGTITVENAGLRVLRTLRFDDRGDVILRPRTDLHSVSFESHTGPHADGLLLDVVIAPSLNPDGEPVTLTFDTGPFTDTLTLGADMRLSHVEVVDDAGHVVSYQIVQPDRDGCAQGFLRGRWQAAGEVDGRVMGYLAGRFFTADGQVRAHMRGVYGKRENGNQVWFAKVISPEGSFLGLIAGRWADGHFAGLILGRGDGDDKIVKGIVRGHYFEGRGDAAAGGFVGRWSERCGEDEREGEPSDTDEPEMSLDVE